MVAAPSGRISRSLPSGRTRPPPQAPSPEKLKELIRKGTLEGEFVPVLTGTAFKNKGVCAPRGSTSW